jgi:5-methylcytosine-specific restriction endonuclease McrA
MKTAKKPKIKPLIKKLDGVFSLYIRERDHHTCFTCGKILEPNKSQNGHYISRKYLSTRWDLRNCNCQCVSCNVFKHGNMDVYAINLQKKYGNNILNELQELKNTVIKYSADTLMDMIEFYKKVINN